MTNETLPKKLPVEKKLFFHHISEYEALHRYDRKPYVKRLLTLYQMVLKAAADREEWVNEARKDAAQAHQQIEEFKKSFWYRVYNWFK